MNVDEDLVEQIMGFYLLLKIFPFSLLYPHNLWRVTARFFVIAVISCLFLEWSINGAIAFRLSRGGGRVKGMAQVELRACLLRRTRNLEQSHTTILPKFDVQRGHAIILKAKNAPGFYTRKSANENAISMSFHDMHA